MKVESHSGYIAIIGRPNVGKSTLLNKILGQKVSITSRKSQTTRHQLLGIRTINNTQAVYVDTPGIHKDKKTSLNRHMNKAAFAALKDVDVIIFLLDAYGWRNEDDLIFEKIKKLSCPVILAINKIDLIGDKKKLLSQIDDLRQKIQFAAIIPISAQKGINIKELEETVNKLLPQNYFLFPEDQLTDRNDQFLAAEIIREKIIRNLSDELPYATSVVIEKFSEENNLVRVYAVIYVERPGQKAIIIGKNGETLKRIGTHARLDMEKLLGKKVFLQLWVKVKTGWTNDEKMLESLGYA